MLDKWDIPVDVLNNALMLLSFCASARKITGFVAEIKPLVKAGFTNRSSILKRVRETTGNILSLFTWL